MKLREIPKRSRESFKQLFLLALISGSLLFVASERTSLIPSRNSGELQLTTGHLQSDPLLVSLLDGRILAIDKGNGSTLWTFDTKSALVSARGAQGYAFTVVPGVQGELYTQAKGQQAGFQMLPHTLPQWVEKTPFVMNDGSLWLGSRHTHAFFVDSKTGELIKLIEEFGEQDLKNTEQLPDAAQLSPGARPILLGRVDYRVRAIHQDTGDELFNVSYSQLSILDSSLKLPAFGETPALDEAEQASNLGISLDPDSKNSIHRVDPQSGNKMWSTGFEQPPITIFAGGEVGNSLYGETVWPTPDGLASRLGMSKKSQPSIMIGNMAGSYYALPMASEAQKAGLLALMPPNASKTIEEEASECDIRPCTHLPDKVMMSEQHQDNLTLQEVEGIHYLDSTPSLFVSKTASPVTLPEASMLTRLVEDIGIMGISSIAGALLVGILAFAKINEKPRVIASLKNKESGVRVLTLSFTGTVEEAYAAQRKSREVEENSPDAPNDTRIRDWTGSGEENNPQAKKNQNKPGANVGKQQPDDGLKCSDQTDSSGRSLDKEGNDAKQDSQDSTEAGTPFSGDSQQGNIEGRSEGEEQIQRKKKKKKRKSKEGEGDREAASERSESEGSEDQVHDTAESVSGRSRESEQSKANGGSSERGETRGTSSDSAPIAPTSPPPTIPDYNAVSSHDSDSRSGNGSHTTIAELPTSLLRVCERRDGVTYVGRLIIGPEIVGYGSSGTLVFEGSLDGRPVAVKRVLRQFYELARKEIAALIVADEHPNIVRCFAMEEDTEFVYLALERCKQSLNDLLGKGNSANAPQFVSQEGQPTDLCMRVCEEVGMGLLALHDRSIVHRDLKPHNVLFTEGMRTKLSDMGLCKRLTTDQTSYDSAGPGGSTGWQAPEQLILRSGGEARQGRSVDIFTFGLLLFYCLSGGQHPFGEGIERDYRILNGQANYKLLAGLPEALSLIQAMLRPQPKQRPSIAAVLAHPFWWPASKKLAFLVDLSNRLENEDREVDRSLLRSLEACAEEAIGGTSWAVKLDAEFLANLGKYRKYNPGSLRDLLRVIRNKHNHFREMPEHLQQRVGRDPDSFVGFFVARFPQLILTAFTFGLTYCDQEAPLSSYFSEGAKKFPFPTLAAERRHHQLFGSNENSTSWKGISDRTNSAPSAMKREPALMSIDETRESTKRAKSDTSLLPPPPPLPRTGRTQQAKIALSGGHRRWWSNSDSGSSEAATDSGSKPSSTDSRDQSIALHRHWKLQNDGGTKQLHAWPAAQAWTRQEADIKVLNGWPMLPSRSHNSLHSETTSRSSDESAAESCSPNAEGIVVVRDALQYALTVKDIPKDVKELHDAEGQVLVFPQKPGGTAPDCDFFIKTGSCKFGEECHFHHPLSCSVKVSTLGKHPMRPGQPVCPFYERTRNCKFGPSCKFHHPASLLSGLPPSPAVAVPTHAAAV